MLEQRFMVTVFSTNIHIIETLLSKALLSLVQGSWYGGEHFFIVQLTTSDWTSTNEHACVYLHQIFNQPTWQTKKKNYDYCFHGNADTVSSLNYFSLPLPKTMGTFSMAGYGIYFWIPSLAVVSKYKRT